MFEIAWQEINAQYRIVTKRKRFARRAALETFTDNLVQRDSFYRIIAYRDPV